MKNYKVTFSALIFFFCLCMAVVLQPLNVQAASKASTASNGKNLYFAVANEIRCMDTNTGKTKTIVKLKNIGVNFDEIVYYKGYVYFSGNAGSPATGEKQYICRVKSKGGKVKKLARGSCPVVYKKKLYYIAYGDSAISRMSLNGKNKKKLLSADTEMINMRIAGNQIYYLSGDYNGYYLNSASLNGKNIKKISSKMESSNMESDGKDIYYTAENTVHRVIGKTGKNIILPNIQGESIYILNVRNGVLYYSDFNRLKKYVVSKNKVYGLKTFKASVWGMTVGKGKYAIIARANPSYAEGEIVGRIKTNGKGYKTLNKYWII